MTSVSIIAFTRAGCSLACDVARALAVDGYEVSLAGPERFAGPLGMAAYESLDSWTAQAFAQSDALLFVSATGIAVRAIAPYVVDKFADPAVASIDERAGYVVPLLSGHVGGANDLAQAIARITGAQPVVSTATDVQGLFAIDVWARENNLAILDRAYAKEVSACLLDGATVGWVSDFAIDGDVPAGFAHGPEGLSCPVGVSVSYDDALTPFARTLRLVPRTVTVGAGCRRDTPVNALAQLVDVALADVRISPAAVHTLASIDVKADEPAFAQLAAERGWSLRFYSADDLAAVPGAFASSEFVKSQVGVDNVCERAACAAGGSLVLGKRSQNGATVAVAATEPALSFAPYAPSEKG